MSQISTFEKECNDFIESIVRSGLKSILCVFRNILLGIKQLRDKKHRTRFLVTLLVSSILAVIEFIFKFDMNGTVKIIYLFMLLLPFLYLEGLGTSYNNEQEKYKKMFKTIEFKGRDNKYPRFIKKYEIDKKIIFKFKSNIPLQDWINNKDRLETSLNCNILKFDQMGSKKLIDLTTVPSDYRIPTEINWNDEYINEKDGEIVVGKSALQTISFNLNKSPHVLVAGETGSGKSVILRTCLWQMICKGSKVYMIDFKGGIEFGIKYEKYGEVVTEREKVLDVLTELCEENDKRLKEFRKLEVKNLFEYNKKTNSKLCRIGFFCDEIAQMLDKKGVSKEEKDLFEKIESKLSTLARLSRATGINLFLGVQRPDANVLHGQIKNNIPIRICGRFADKAASEIVLGNTDAVKLPDVRGRFFYKSGNETIEFQAYYFNDDTMLKEIDVQLGDMMNTQAHDHQQVQEQAQENVHETCEEVRQVEENSKKETRNREFTF